MFCFVYDLASCILLRKSSNWSSYWYESPCSTFRWDLALGLIPVSPINVAVSSKNLPFTLRFRSCFSWSFLFSISFRVISFSGLTYSNYVWKFLSINLLNEFEVVRLTTRLFYLRILGLSVFSLPKHFKNLENNPYGFCSWSDIFGKCFWFEEC